ncbi:MAG: winged helix-turn-helix domain-containing protein [Deltaproteobacteria bacterium]|nr:winged helix-turn-helix domain-containing protein [Deltaproteobacteria bacterium]
MSQTGEEADARKEAMKNLRKVRKATIKAAAARVKEQNQAVKAIKEQLKESPGTVPEIAEGAGMVSSEVMWYIATLKKYGQVLESDQDGSYFRYQLAEG